MLIKVNPSEQILQNELKKNRNHFVKIVIALAQNASEKNSFWGSLAMDCLKRILHYTDCSRIGKTAPETTQFVLWMFQNVGKLKEVLKENQGFTILEKKVETVKATEYSFRIDPNVHEVKGRHLFRHP